MTGAAKGILMLTCPLGDEAVNVLSYRQFHGLRRRVEQLDRGSDKELTESDLRAMGLPAETAAMLLRLLDRERELDAYLTVGRRKEAYPLTRLDPNYPRHLENKLKSFAPPALFCKGDAQLLKLPCAAVVGSRKIFEDNRRFAWHVGEVAAKEGYAIVSGGAPGADSAAQDACLRNGGKVIIFTPEPLGTFRNDPNILYISEEGWDMGFSARRALNRNRLIHAMGEKAFVAQCVYRKGGSWRGAEENLKYGYSTTFVYWDRSPGARGLLELGAIEVTELHSIRELKTGQQSFFE